MKQIRRRRLAALIALLAIPLLAAACGGTADEQGGAPPAVTEQVKGSDVVQVKLTAEAAQRLGVKTQNVRSDASGGTRTVIPYEALLYDPDGKTWTYISPRHLVFERMDVSVARIVGDSAILTAGPPVGTPVVTSGATEIWGVEYGGIKED